MAMTMDVKAREWIIRRIIGLLSAKIEEAQAQVCPSVQLAEEIYGLQEKF